MLDDYTHLLKPVLALAQQAGVAVMKVYTQAVKIEVMIKADKTPLTEADLLANDIIVEGLQALTPGIPILSEEMPAPSFAERQTWQQYWLIDPIDGTTEFIEGTDEFVISIALIEGNVPVLGVIYAPVFNIAYEATRGCGAFKHSADGTYEFINARAMPKDSVSVALSRRHGKKTEELCERFGTHELVLRGSALKFGLLAEGSADIYPRIGPTSEWDTAAGQCILEEAGGKVVDFAGESLRYNTKESLENPPFIAMGDAQLEWPKYFSKIN